MPVFNLDYLPHHPSTTISFGSCEKRKCVTICIVDDVILENTESFHITVERPSDVDTRITVDPAAGTVTIFDDDGMLHVVQWNLSNADTLGAEESVLAFGTAKSVLFIKVSSFQGVLIRGVPLHVVRNSLKL